MSLTSIIMVSYHTGPVIEQAIAAIKELAEPVELVLVNNGNPPEIEKDFAKRFEADPDIHYITGHGNIGFGKGCNLGVQKCKGEKILLLNPDSILPTDALRHLQQQEKGLERPYMLGARLLDDNEKEQSGCRRALLTPVTAFVESLGLYRFFPQYRLNYHTDPVPKGRTQMPAISGAFMYLNKKDFEAIHGFDEGYFLHVEDLDLCYRFTQSGGKIYYLPRLVVTHVGGTSEVSSEFIEKHKAISFSRYFRENFAGKYPYFVIWALDLMIWTRFILKVHVLRRLKPLFLRLVHAVKQG